MGKVRRQPASEPSFAGGWRGTRKGRGAAESLRKLREAEQGAASVYGDPCLASGPAGTTHVMLQSRKGKGESLVRDCSNGRPKVLSPYPHNLPSPQEDLEPVSYSSSPAGGVAVEARGD